MSFFQLSAGLAACSIALSGCFVEAGTTGGGEPAPSVGTITLLSSIEGSTRPSACDSVGATDLELAVYDGAELYTTVTADCHDFSLTASLPDGTYRGEATLLDGHAAASTTLELDGLRIVSGTDLQVEIDFPTSSILP